MNIYRITLHVVLLQKNDQEKKKKKEEKEEPNPKTKRSRTENEEKHLQVGPINVQEKYSDELVNRFFLEACYPSKFGKATAGEIATHYTQWLGKITQQDAPTIRVGKFNTTFQNLEYVRAFLTKKRRDNRVEYVGLTFREML